MSYYRAGISSQKSLSRNYRDGIVVGLLPGFVGTDDAKRELALLNGEVASANKELYDFTGNATLADPLNAWFVKGGWQQFYKRWQSFYSDNKGFWDRFWSPKDIFNKTQDFRREYIALREFAESNLGMTWGSVAPRGPLETPSITGDLASSIGIGQLFKYAAIALLLVGGFILIIAFAK